MAPASLGGCRLGRLTGAHGNTPAPRCDHLRQNQVMTKKSARSNSNPLEEKIKKFIADLNSQLGYNFVVAFQFISLDKVGGHNLDWHLYSIREEEYLKATYKFIGLEEGEKRGIKRTVLNLEFQEGPYCIKHLGPSRILKIPDGPAGKQFILNLDYTYYERELEFDINTPPKSDPPPGKATSDLEDLIDYWVECLKESIGRGGSLMWVSQKHASRLGKITSSVFCLFNERFADDKLEYKVSKQIREFIIDHNIELYIAPQTEKIRTLTTQIRKLGLSDEEFLSAVRLENPQVVIGPEISDRLLRIRRALETTIPILITGETGTGKEIIAQIIHKSSGRPPDSFIALNCAGFSEGDMLIDSHLFGHTKGAFTGATKDRDGYFKRYSDGTIFLDEVQQIPRGTQGKLKRVVEYKDYTPVGSDESRKTGARLIFAANQSLAARVKNEDFLEDLFYRISVVRIHIPPLRERMDEIESLISAFINKYRDDFPFMEEKSLDDNALNKLKDYHYPGNIRELQNVLLRAYMISGDSSTISSEHIIFDEILESPQDYHIQTDPNRPKQIQLAGVLKSLKLSVDDLLRQDPTNKISLKSVLGNTHNLSEEFRLRFKTSENLTMTYLKKENKDDILSLITLNSAYFRNSLCRLQPFSKWLEERAT